jgi:PIN domain nuclease of toxin-antitoxin system
MLLLDTCTILWLAAGSDKLSPKAKKSLLRNCDALFISAITGFEIARKHATGKLDLPMNPKRWYELALETYGLKEIPVTGEIAIASALLPPLHNDPCDRIIIATAKANNLKIVTCDELIAQYSQIETLW